MAPATLAPTRRQFQLTLLGCCLLPALRRAESASPAVKESPDELVDATNQLALALLRDFEAAQSHQNQFLSPYSIQSALLLALEGAAGETAAEMRQALQLPEKLLDDRSQGTWAMKEVRRQYQLLARLIAPPESTQAVRKRSQIESLRKQLAAVNGDLKSLAQAGKFQQAERQWQVATKLAEQVDTLAAQVDQYELETANALWVDRSFPLAPQYQQIVQQFYGSSEASVADFKSAPEAERARINAWVSQRTREKIQNILPAGSIDSATRLVLANAVYFRGTWAAPFSESETVPAAFTRYDGQTSQVSLMSRLSFKRGTYAAFEADGTPYRTPTTIREGATPDEGYPATDGFQVAELPYNGDRLSMLVLLPRAHDGLDALLQSLTAERLRTISQALVRRDFHLYLPKFKLETSYGLNNPLRRLGMRQAFEDLANFSGLTDSLEDEHRLMITNVLHKAFVEVNEKGTEAAAATVITFAPTNALIRDVPFVPEFRADRPFLFVIRERQTGLVLFIGKYEGP
jgi:serine protease inhibitor